MFPAQACVRVHACLYWVCCKCQGRCYQWGYCRWWSLISWDHLIPQEAAVENVGPVDDGTESLGDVPSLSEEVTGIDICCYWLRRWRKYGSTFKAEKVAFKPILWFHILVLTSCECYFRSCCGVQTKWHFNRNCPVWRRPSGWYTINSAIIQSRHKLEHLTTSLSRGQKSPYGIFTLL